MEMGIFSGESTNFLTSKGIEHDHTCAYTPSKNGHRKKEQTHSKCCPCPKNCIFVSHWNSGMITCFQSHITSIKFHPQAWVIRYHLKNYY